ncbi:MAG: nuclear transport factor 2 family protein [Cyanobacteria bacterium P01_H01_bin.15]
MTLEPEIVQQKIADYYRHLSNFELEPWLACMTPDAEIYDPVGSPPLLPSQDGAKFMGFLTQIYAKFEITLGEIFVAGNAAAVQWEMTVTGRNGRSTKAQGIGTFTITEDGRFSRTASYWDDQALKAALRE